MPIGRQKPDGRQARIASLYAELKAARPTASDDEIFRFIDAELGAAAPPAPTAPAPPAYEKGLKELTSLPNTLLRGVPLVGGFTDEVMGGVQGVGKFAAQGWKDIANVVRGKPVEDHPGFLDTLKHSIADERDAESSVERKYPGMVVPGQMAVGGSAVKGLVTNAPAAASKLLLTPANVPEGAGAVKTIGRVVGKAAAGGGLEGAAYGFGNTEGGLGDRASGAMGQGLTGLLLSAGLSVPVAAATAKHNASYRKALQRIPDDATGGWQSIPDDELSSARFIDNAWGADRADAATDAAMIGPTNAAASDIPDARVMDLGGRNTRATTKVAAALGGDAATELSGMAEARAAGRPERLARAVETATGIPRQNPAETARHLRAMAEPDIARLYDQAYRDGEVLTDAGLRKLLLGKSTESGLSGPRQPLLKKAVRAVMVEMQNEGITLPRSAPGKGNRAETLVSLDFADRVKKYLDTEWQTALRKDEPNRARIAAGLRTKLVQKLDQLVPSYQPARQAHEAAVVVDEAQKLGQAIGRGTKDIRDWQFAVDQMIPAWADETLAREIQSAFQSGVADAAQVKIASRSGAKALTALGGTEKADAITEMAVPPERRGAFQRALSGERSAAANERAAMTAAQGPQLAHENAFGAATPWALKEAAIGNPQLLAMQLLGNAERTGQSEQAGKIAAQLAKDLGIRINSPEYQDLVRRIARVRLMDLRPVRPDATQMARTQQIGAAVAPSMLSRIFGP